MKIRKKNTRYLGAELDADLVSKFRSQAKERGFVSKRLIRILVEFWLGLDSETQSRLYNQVSSWKDFEDVISHIIDQKLKVQRKDFKKIANQLIRSALKRTGV